MLGSLTCCEKRCSCAVSKLLPLAADRRAVMPFILCEFGVRYAPYIALGFFSNLVVFVVCFWDMAC